MRKYKPNILCSLVLCMLCTGLPLSLSGCGSSGSAPADQPMTEITRTETTAPTEPPAETTATAPEPVQSGTTVRVTVTEQTAASAAETSAYSDETTEPTEPASDITTAESTSVVTSASTAPEHVRIVISAEEIMQAAGIPVGEILSGVLDIENTAADAGNVMVARERPWGNPDVQYPDWLYCVTEIDVDGVTPGQTVTVTGIAVDHECDWNAAEENWYVAHRVPFTITRTAGSGN